MDCFPVIISNFKSTSLFELSVENIFNLVQFSLINYRTVQDREVNGVHYI